MVNLSSRSAKVLVIFVVAIIAFCLACVCASMTGPISILPNESSGGILDNLSELEIVGIAMVTNMRMIIINIVVITHHLVDLM